jgi:predicted nucleic acid-binding protein
MSIVSNVSPLINLARIGKLNLLLDALRNLNENSGFPFR